MEKKMQHYMEIGPGDVLQEYTGHRSQPHKIASGNCHIILIRSLLLAAWGYKGPIDKSILCRFNYSSNFSSGQLYKDFQ